MTNLSPILPRHATATSVEMPEAVKPATNKKAGAFAALSATFALVTGAVAYNLVKQNDTLEARVENLVKDASDARLTSMRDALEAPGAFQLSTPPLSVHATASLQPVAPAANVEDGRLAEMSKAINDPNAFQLPKTPLVQRTRGR